MTDPEKLLAHKAVDVLSFLDRHIDSIDCLYNDTCMFYITDRPACI